MVASISSVKGTRSLFAYDLLTRLSCAKRVIDFAVYVSNNASDISFFPYLSFTLVLYKYTIHEIVHCVAVADSEAITRGDK